jgi:hypothetical protein
LLADGIERKALSRSAFQAAQLPVSRKPDEDAPPFSFAVSSLSPTTRSSPKSIQAVHSTKPCHTMPSLNDCGWNSHGDSVRAAIANQTCHVVIAKT